MERLTIEIAAVPFAVEVPTGGLAEALRDAWRDFRAPASAGALSVRFTCDERAAPTGPRTMPTASGSTIRGAGFEATLRGAHAELVGADERFGVESVLKLMLARALLPRGGLLVHSVGLSAGDFAAVLLGESGAGKSTLGALGAQHGLRRLSDELVAVAEDRAWATPWNTGAGGSATLRLLGTLGWSNDPRLEPVAPADFLPLLLSNTLLPDDAPSTRAEVFKLASRLLAAHPPRRFFFPPDKRAADFLREHLQ